MILYLNSFLAIATFWSSYSGRVLSGLNVTAVSAIAIWGFNVLRSRRLESRLRQALAPDGIWHGDTGAGVIVSNKTNVPVVVRCVKLIRRTQGSVVLNFFGPSQGRSSGARFPEKAVGGSLSHGAALDRGFIELPAFCEGSWGLSLKSLQHPAFANIDPIDCEVIIEYSSLLGSRKLTTITGGELFDGDGLAEFLRAVRDGDV